MLRAAPLAEKPCEGRLPRASRWSGAKASPENRDRHGQDGPKHRAISWRAPALDRGRR
jgi:hypothetical protein